MPAEQGGGVLTCTDRSTTTFTGNLVREGNPEPYQCPGTHGNFPDYKSPGDNSHRQKGTHRMRQHVSRDVYQPPRRSPFIQLSTGSTKPLPVADTQEDLPQGNTQTWGGQHPGGFSQQESGRLEGVEPQQEGLRPYLPDLGLPDDRSVCQVRQQQTSNLLFTDARPSSSGDRRFESQVGEHVCLLLSPSHSVTSDLGEDQEGTDKGRTNSPPMAQMPLVPTPAQHVCGHTTPPPHQARPTYTAPGGEGDTPQPQLDHLAPSGLEAERISLRDRGLSEQAVQIATARLRPSSRQVYDAKWQAFTSWCTEGNIDPYLATVAQILNFLSTKAEQLAASTLKGYITAISQRIPNREGFQLSLHPTVIQWRKGVEKTKGVTRSIVPPWSLELVLAALKKAPFEPMETSTLQYLTWKTTFLVAVASARRASELHALCHSSPYLQFQANAVTLFTNIKFTPKVNKQYHALAPINLPVLKDDSDPSLRLLCVCRALRIYLNRVEHHRQEHVQQLFLAYGRGVRGHAISKQRISRWLVETISFAYTSIDQTPPEGIKGHQTRSQSTSWAETAGVDPDSICLAATWSTQCTFAKHYRLNILEAQKADFGRRVLSLAGSSKASASALDRYKIPKKKKRRK